jgi:hypothetical protein
MYRVLVLGALAAGLGQPDVRLSAEDKKADDKLSAKVKGATVKTASSINFAKVLGLSFDSAYTLGSRIDEARRKSEPVTLALLGVELDAFEKATGKKADLTAADLTKEAVELAKMRRIAAELKTVGALVRDDAVAKDLDQLAKQTQKLEDDQVASIKKNPKIVARGLDGTLTVQNGTEYTMDIYVNGVHYGWVGAYRNYTFKRQVYHGPTTNTVLLARPRGNPDSQWGPTVIRENYTEFTWNLDP